MEKNKIKSVECEHCARVHKPNEQCSFVKAQFYYCKRYRRISPACNKKQGRLSQTEDKCSCDSGNENMNGIYVCAEKSYAPITTYLLINDARLLMEIDSGASITIISQHRLKKLWLIPPPLKSTNVKLVTWTWVPLKVLGLARVQVVIKQ